MLAVPVDRRCDNGGSDGDIDIDMEDAVPEIGIDIDIGIDREGVIAPPMLIPPVTVGAGIGIGIARLEEGGDLRVGGRILAGYVGEGIGDRDSDCCGICDCCCCCVR